MNFNKTNNLTLELDKNKSEIIIEDRINELFDFADLKSELMIEYYNQILTPYLISLNINPNEYCGYTLKFYYGSDSKVYLLKNKKEFDEGAIKIKFNSEIWKETNQFLKNKKYEKVIKNVSKERSFIITTFTPYSRLFFDAKNQPLNEFCEFEVQRPFWKNDLKIDLMDTQLQYIIDGGAFESFINIKNKEDLRLSATLKNKVIKIYYKNDFIHNFPYKMAKDKKEVIDMLLNLKRQVEYEINIKNFNK